MIYTNLLPLEGQAGNLGIILRSYEPAYIECGTAVQRYTPNDNCAELLAAIPAEVAPAIRWGPGGRGLPYFWQLQGWLSFLSFFLSIYPRFCDFWICYCCVFAG